MIDASESPNARESFDSGVALTSQKLFACNLSWCESVKKLGMQTVLNIKRLLLCLFVFC